MVEIFGTEEFEDWFDSLEKNHQDAVARVVDLLELRGWGLGHPYSSAIKGTKEAMRELRIQSSKHAIRVFYAFDPRRNAILLLGGDKTGRKRFYATMVPKAERLLKEYLHDTEENGDGS